MWTCEQCGSNLLDQTADCPVCKLPAALNPNRTRPAAASHKESSTARTTIAIVVLGTALFVWRENHQQNRYDRMSAEFSQQIGAVNGKINELELRISRSESTDMSTRTD